jgi:hypothetical protein
MELLTQEVAEAFLAARVSPHAAARDALIAEIRAAHEEAGLEGPAAARFTLEELVERGITSKSGKSSGLKASRNGNGPIALVRTEDEGTVLIVLNPETEDENDA